MSIKAVSFDLDDTLWPLLPVILKAEKDTNNWLVKNYPGVKKLLESEEIISIRNELISHEGELVNQLSKLRKLVFLELGIRSGYKKEEAEIMAKESFKVFFSGRNDVKLYQGTEKTLKRLKEKFSENMKFFEFYLADKLIILSGSDTSPLEPSPFLIKSTNSIPLTTFPKTVYCRSKEGVGLKHIKN